MLLKCVRPFGNKKPGDTVEVPDGAEFDQMYFALAPVKKSAPVEKTEEKEKADDGD